jgi:site-specific DNA-methyltransferase (cytosine-N4-specific)
MVCGSDKTSGDQCGMMLQGDALTMLRTLPDESAHMALTSPPYWQLRDYHVAGQLGLERSYEEYITTLCDVFDEVKRVLRPDGTCWVNLADSYSGHHGGYPSPLHEKARRLGYMLPSTPQSDIPRKSLCLIPSRFAIEMVRRGWILRNTIIWHKPNVVPESVKDRFTIDFEYLFFFAKSPRYYFRQQFEPSTQPVTVRERPARRNKRCVWAILTKGFPGNHCATYPEALLETPIQAGCPEGGVVLDPFLGSGTTALAAEQLGRRWVGIELNPEYVQMAAGRVRARAAAQVA